MPTLFTPEFGKQRASALEKNDSAIRFQGDVGWGVMTEARAARNEFNAIPRVSAAKAAGLP